MAGLLYYNKINFFIYPILLSSFFFISNIIIMHFGHFHEDAYILFIYVENLVNGNGITYFPTGEPIEGATDFLWLIFIAFFVFVGMDVGTSVIFLNSIGVLILSTIIVFLISDLNEKNKQINKKNYYILLILLPVMWIPQSYLTAGVGGFSVFFYISIIGLALFMLYKRVAMNWLPIVSLVIALFRPDGVLIGFGITLAGLYFSYLEKNTRTYLLMLILSIAGGLIYFYLRYFYFGNFLPLPLYVKSSDGGLVGVGENLKWFFNSGSFIFFTLLFTLAFITKNIKKYLFLALPALILFTALLFATQSQNVGYRFQAPIYITAYLIFVFLILDMIKKETFNGLKKFIVYACIAFIFMVGVRNILALNYFTSFNYINEFPLKLDGMISDLSSENFNIVLTEAGRIAFWNQNYNIKIYDAVGLNTVYPAKNKIDISYIKTLRPDLIMFHHARTLSVDDLPINVKFNRVNGQDLFRKSNFLRVNENSKVIHAANTLSDYLYHNFEEFDVYLVDYTENGSFSHVYAIRRKYNLSASFERSLDQIFSQRNVVSYYEMISKLEK